MTATISTTHRSDVAPEYYRRIPVHAAFGVHAAVLERVRSIAGPEARILELGAGSGGLTQRLLDSGFKPVSLDLSRDGWLVPDHPVLEADLNVRGWERCLPQQEFDVVLCVEVIEHLENPTELARSLGRLVIPGGWVVISTPNPVGSEALLSALRNGWFTYFTPADFHGSGHRTVVAPATLVGMLEEQGFRISELRTVGRIESSLPKRAVFHVVNWARTWVAALRGNTSLNGPVLLCLARRAEGGPT
jgi:2-polyprenyl-3-methyl-5-hydroxy-6-metoxy-1,4-benzoquinol methylase